MAILSDGALERLSAVIEISKTVFHYGYIPAILYIGLKTGADPGMPPISIFNLIW